MRRFFKRPKQTNNYELIGLTNKYLEYYWTGNCFRNNDYEQQLIINLQSTIECNKPLTIIYLNTIALLIGKYNIQSDVIKFFELLKEELKR